MSQPSGHRTQKSSDYTIATMLDGISERVPCLIRPTSPFSDMNQEVKRENLCNQRLTARWPKSLRYPVLSTEKRYTQE